MSRTQTYFFAIEVGSITTGQQYETLPLHCTLMHRFHSELTAEELSSAVRPLFAATPPFALIPTERTVFGPNRVLVQLLDPSPELAALHAKLFDILNQLGVQYTEQDWVGDGYIPHVTDQLGKRFTGRACMVASIFLASVEFPLSGSRRFIEAKFPVSV